MLHGDGGVETRFNWIHVADEAAHAAGSVACAAVTFLVRDER